jgi:hypothetical protein
VLDGEVMYSKNKQVYVSLKLSPRPWSWLTTVNRPERRARRHISSQRRREVFQSFLGFLNYRARCIVPKALHMRTFQEDVLLCPLCVTSKETYAGSIACEDLRAAVARFPVRHWS